MKIIFLFLLKFFLRFLAKETLNWYKPGIIGITGNVGKTSAKEAVKTVLSVVRRVRSASKNFNNELGLPLVILSDVQKTGSAFFWLKIILVGFFQLVFKKKSYPEILLLEYGVDRPGDMKYLLDIARPQIAIVTAIGDIPVHVEFFVGSEGIAKEKSKIISQLPSTGFAILNADDEKVLKMKDQTRAQIISFGFSKSADMRISSFEEYISGAESGIRFKLSNGGRFVPVRIKNSLGKTQCYSSAAAACVGSIFGLNLVRIAETLASYEPPVGRLKLVPGLKQSLIIDDTYNASPSSMNEALDTLKRLKASRKIAVLGDMLELGQYTMEAHSKIGEKVPKIADILITVGLRGKFIAEAALKNRMNRKFVFSFINLDEAGLALQRLIKKGDLILVKASQGVRLEKIVKEVMAEPDRAEELLVRQNTEWLAKPGMYDTQNE